MELKSWGCGSSVMLLNFSIYLFEEEEGGINPLITDKAEIKEWKHEPISP